VRGPAGFGKTTLLAQAYRQVVARGQKAVWLDCSELDADPGHFLDSLYAAAMSIGMDGSDLEFTIADFAKRLARIDAAVYLFLDEFERLAATAVEEMIERLAAALPGGAHMIIASRQAPRTWYLKRELRGLATTIEALDLRLTGTELQMLLSERFNTEEADGSPARAAAQPRHGRPARAARNSRARRARSVRIPGRARRRVAFRRAAALPARRPPPSARSETFRSRSRIPVARHP
jgi:hypothetical protein